MAAYESDAETVFLGVEMGGDEGKDIQWDAVYSDEGVPPFADSRQRGRGILVKLRNLIEGEAAKEINTESLLRNSPQ